MNHFWITKKSLSDPSLTLFSYNTNNGTKVEHTCVNLLVKFCHDLYYLFQGNRYTKMAQISFWIHSLRGPGLALYQIGTNRSHMTTAKNFPQYTLSCLLEENDWIFITLLLYLMPGACRTHSFSVFVKSLAGSGELWEMGASTCEFIDRAICNTRSWSRLI